MRPCQICLIFLLFLSGCGQFITPEAAGAVRPTPTSLPTPTLVPTVTPRPTATPRPATPEPTPTPSPTPTPIVHVVQAGEVLSVIARQYGVPANAIQEANGISDPRLLQVEQVLIIPNPDDNGGTEPTPTATPFPVAFRGVNFQETPQGSLWCLGEVSNPGNVLLSEIVVEVSLFDADGSLLAVEAAYPQLDLLLPNASVPFAILFTTPPSSFAQYQITAVSASPIYGQPAYYLDLQAVETSASWQGNNSYRIRGQLENVGEASATQIKLVAVAYDEANQVLGQRQASLAVERLRSKARTEFEIDLVLPQAEVSRYVVQAQALRVP